MVAPLIGNPSTSHVKAGVAPPLVGTTVKITEDPRQDGFALAVMVADTGIELATFMVMALDVAGLPVTHVSGDVTTHVTTWPFTGIYVKVLLVAPPEGAPLTIHWYE